MTVPGVSENPGPIAKGQGQSTLFQFRNLGEASFLLLVFLFPFSGLSFMSVALGIRGLTLPFLLATVMMASLVFDSAMYRFSDLLEKRAVLIFFSFSAFCAWSFARSLPNLTTFHAVFPEFYPSQQLAYIKNQFIEPFLYASTFLIVVKKLDSKDAILRFLTAYILSVAVFGSIIIIALILEPQYLITNQRTGLVYICETYVGMHYTDAGTVLAFAAPAALYMGEKRGGWYHAAYILIFVAVIVDQART